MSQNSNDRKIVSLAEGRKDRARRDTEQRRAERKARRGARVRTIPPWLILVALAAIIGGGIYLFQASR